MPGETEADGTDLMKVFVLVRKIILNPEKNIDLLLKIERQSCQITKLKSIFQFHFKSFFS